MRASSQELVTSSSLRGGSQDFTRLNSAQNRRCSFVAFLPKDVHVDDLGIIDLEECQHFSGEGGGPSPRHAEEADNFCRTSRVYFREITEVFNEMEPIPEDGSPCVKPEATLQTVRVLQPVRRTQRISTEKSLASQVFGKGSATEAFLFHYIAKNRISSSVLWLLWYVGLVVGLLGLANVLPVEWTTGSLLMLPLPLCNALVLSVDLVREVSNEFEAKVLWFLQGVMFGAGFLSLDDNKKVFWLSLAPAMYFSLLVDAYPAKFRGFFTKMFFVSKALALISWDVLVLTGWGHFRNTAWTLGRLHGATVATSFTTSITLLIFCYRHLKTAWTQADRCVIIKSAVRTFHAEVELELESVDGVAVPTGFRLVQQEENLRLSFANPEEALDIKTRGTDGKRLSGTPEQGAGGSVDNGRPRPRGRAAAAEEEDDKGPAQELFTSPRQGHARTVRSRDSGSSSGLRA